ncbi:MAG: DUF456 family protein [Acidimicrobiia bacterium]|nr:DUF456 family protein [Acidimicrobiia bacterium]
MNDPVLFVLTAGVIVIGVVGTIVPLLPGLALVWLAALAWGMLTSFGTAGFLAMTTITLLFGAGIYLGLRIPQKSAAAQGLSIRGTVLGVLLAIGVGIVIPVVGIPLGFVLGVWIVRIADTGDARAAFSSALATTAALLRASAAQFGIGVAMGSIWLLWALSA